MSGCKQCLIKNISSARRTNRACASNDNYRNGIKLLLKFVLTDAESASRSMRREALPLCGESLEEIFDFFRVVFSSAPRTILFLQGNKRTMGEILAHVGSGHKKLFLV